MKEDDRRTLSEMSSNEDILGDILDEPEVKWIQISQMRRMQI